MIYNANSHLSDKLRETIKNAINADQIISFPTETVYALAGNAQSNKSIEAVYAIKERDANKRLSLLLPDIKTAQDIAVISPNALKTGKHFWPGALTLILPLRQNSNLAPHILSTYDTIGIRIPDHPIALNILNAIDTPIFATSANISGAEDNITAHDVEQNLGNKVKLIIDGGTSEIMIPSTVLDMTSNTPKILRQGTISHEEIMSVLE